MILFLVKMFENKEHADDLIKGRLFLNRLSYFKKIEGDDGRHDENEGAIMLQIEGLTLKMESRDIDTGELHTFTVTDFASPPVLRPEWFDHIHLYCMYAGHTGEFQRISPDNIEDFRRQLELPEDAEKLGRHAVVIINVPEFIRRVGDAISQEGYGIMTQLVKYYDPEVGSPPVRSEVETIFTKRKKFADQSEFRIAMDTRTVGCDPITLEIGQINDIAYYTNTSDINGHIRMTVQENELTVWV